MILSVGSDGNSCLRKAMRSCVNLFGNRDD